MVVGLQHEFQPRPFVVFAILGVEAEAVILVGLQHILYTAQLVCVHLERDTGRLIESDILLLVAPVIEDVHCQTDAQFVVRIFGSAVKGSVCGVFVIVFCAVVRVGVDPDHVGILPGFLWEGDRGHAVRRRYGRLAVGMHLAHCLGCRVGDGHFLYVSDGDAHVQGGSVGTVRGLHCNHVNIISAGVRRLFVVGLVCEGERARRYGESIRIIA